MNAHAPTAAELPVTRAMLSAVRTELLERIDQSKNELRGEIQELRSDLRAEIQELRGELRGEIQRVEGGLQREIRRVDGGLHAVRAGLDAVQAGLLVVQAGLHAVHAEVARIGLLVEEQNARNKVVLDGLMAMIARQERLEVRVDKVEDTVRGLASARPPR